MIQDIEPHVFDNTFKIQKPTPFDRVLCYQDNQILLHEQDGEYEIPVFDEFSEKIQKNAQYLFSIDKTGFFLVDNCDEVSLPEYQWKPLRFLRKFQPEWCAFAGITGSQMYRFKESRKYCGKCGSHTAAGLKERSYVCTVCGHTEYPKISPAVIVAVTDENRLLMTKYAYGDYKEYALIAGFVELGETFEEAVKREVMEEVGLKVKNIRYYKNQPWAFSDSQMIGFFAELDGDDSVILQESELSEAVWFDFEHIPVNPSKISISQELIDAVRSGKYKEY